MVLHPLLELRLVDFNAMVQISGPSSDGKPIDEPVCL